MTSIPTTLRKQGAELGWLMVSSYLTILFCFYVVRWIPSGAVWLVGGLLAIALHKLVDASMEYFDRNVLGRFVHAATFRLPVVARTMANWAAFSVLVWVAGTIWFANPAWVATVTSDVARAISASELESLRQEPTLADPTRLLADIALGNESPYKHRDSRVVILLAGRFWATGLALVLSGLRLSALVDPLSLRRYPRLEDRRLEPLSGSPIRIAHLSDLHVSAGDDRAEEGGSHDEVFAQALGRLGRSRSRPDLVLISGDVTDRGTPAHWQRFEDIIGRSDNAWVRDRLVFVVGNHDVNVSQLNGRASQIMDLDMDGRRRALCRLRFLKGLLRLCRCRITYLNNGKLVPIDNVAREVRQLLMALEDAQVLSEVGTNVTKAVGTDDAIDAVNCLWRSLFPMVAYVPGQGGRGLALILLDSNAPSSSALSNAYGYVDAPILHRMDAIAALVRRESFEPVVVLHHHPALHPAMTTPPFSIKSPLGTLSRLRLFSMRVTKFADSIKHFFVFEPAMIIENAEDVIAALRECRISIALHGHQHFSGIGELKDGDWTLTVVAAASTTCDGASPAGYRILQIAPGDEDLGARIGIEQEVLAADYGRLDE